MIATLLLLGVLAQAAEPLYQGRTQAQWEAMHTDLDPGVRMAVARALASFPSGSETALASLVQDNASSVSFLAAQTLAVRGPGAVPHLLRLFEIPEACERISHYMALYPETRGAFIAAFRKQLTSSYVICGLKDDSWAVGMAGPSGITSVLEKLEPSQRSDLQSVFLDALKHPAVTVRIAGIQALAVAPVGAESKRAIDGMKKDKNEQVKRFAKGALSK